MGLRIPGEPAEEFLEECRWGFRCIFEGTFAKIIIPVAPKVFLKLKDFGKRPEPGGSPARVVSRVPPGHCATGGAAHCSVARNPGGTVPGSSLKVSGGGFQRSQGTFSTTIILVMLDPVMIEMLLKLWDFRKCPG